MKVGNKLKHVNFLMCWGRVVVSPISSLEFAAAKSLHSCPTLCNPRDSSPPSSAVPRTLQVRTLEWVAISFSNAWKWKVKVKSLSRVRLPATPWTAAHQAPPSMGFSRQKYRSGVPLPSPQDTWYYAANSKCLVNIADHLRCVRWTFIYHLRCPNTDFILVLAIFFAGSEPIGFHEPESLWLGLYVHPAQAINIEIPRILLFNKCSQTGK